MCLSWRRVRSGTAMQGSTQHCQDVAHATETTTPSTPRPAPSYSACRMFGDTRILFSRHSTGRDRDQIKSQSWVRTGCSPSHVWPLLYGSTSLQLYSHHYSHEAITGLHIRYTIFDVYLELQSVVQGSAHFLCSSSTTILTPDLNRKRQNTIPTTIFFVMRTYER